jgi:hypothetical protein
LAHFCNTSFIFFYLRHFTFILQHLVLMVKNKFSHILICMLDEVIKKMIIVLVSNKKTFRYPQNEKFKPKRKAIPLWCYSINTMGKRQLVHALKGVLLMPKLLFNACAILLLRYIRNPLGSITYILEFGGVLYSPNKMSKENNTRIIL